MGQRCPHAGCQEAKLLHLHLKTCNAGGNNNSSSNSSSSINGNGGGECPMMYHGCEQSRKLLAHYRRCRTLRSRLATGSNAPSMMSGNSSSNNSSSSTKQQSASSTLSSHHCLVCSLVARQARTMLERTAPQPTTTTNGMNVFKSSSTNLKRNILSNSATTRQKLASYAVLTASTNEKLLPSSLHGRNGFHNLQNSTTSTGDNNGNIGSPTAALKMPPPPPRIMKNMSTMVNKDSNNSSSICSDSLARLYATAKQLDTVTAMDSHADVDLSDHYPVVRRERSVSDTELFNYKSTTSIPVVEMQYQDKYLDDGTPTTNDTTTEMMMVDDDDDDDDNNHEDDIDEIIHATGNSSGMLRQPKQRVRSASCGSGATTSQSVAAVVSLSPSHHHFCETIVEEEL